MSSKPPEVTRRDVLRKTLGAASLQALAPLCCTSPELPPASFRFEGATLVVDLRRAPELRRAGAAAAIVDGPRGLNLILACTDEGRYAALERTCTHGGAMCAYNHRRRTLRCTSLNHAEYALDGRLLHGRSHGDLRAYPARRDGASVLIRLEPA